MGRADEADFIGDDGTFEAFAAARAGWLYSLALLFTGEREAEAVVIEVLERASRKWRRIVRRGTPERQVQLMLVSSMTGRWHRPRHHREQGAVLPSMAADSPGGQALRAALAKLPPSERAAVVLHADSADRRGVASPSDTELQRQIHAWLAETPELELPDLMDRIDQRARRASRQRTARAAGAAAGLAVVIALLTGGQQGSAPHASGHAETPGLVPHGPPSSPSAVKGTALRDCAGATWGKLPRGWRAQSLAVGPVWFVDARSLGYLHAAAAAAATQPRKPRRLAVMTVEVRYATTAVLKVAPASRSYFRFVNGFHQGGANSLPHGETGFTLAGCPAGTSPGPNGNVTDFYLGFSVETGRKAAVDIWWPGARRPTRVFFTSPNDQSPQN